jgi:hypothetical protein
MIYPETSSNHAPMLRDSQPAGGVIPTPDMDYRASTHYEAPMSAVSRYSGSFLAQDEDKSQILHQHRNLDIVSNNHRPPPAKRGPFKSNAEREQTAETRRIGSCIRCRMQRIRVSFSRRGGHVALNMSIIELTHFVP